MKNTGSYGYHDDWEASEEISPDPFSEEEHSRMHKKRFSKNHAQNNVKTNEIKNNSKQDGEIQS